MTQITGVRKLKHTNSFTGQVPKYGVETPHKEELGKVKILSDSECNVCALGASHYGWKRQ